MVKKLSVVVEKRVEFDVQELAIDAINKLYDMMEWGVQQDDWQALSEDQQKELVLTVLTEAVRIEKEGRV